MSCELRWDFAKTASSSAMLPTSTKAVLAIECFPGRFRPIQGTIINPPPTPIATRRIRMSIHRSFQLRMTGEVRPHPAMPTLERSMIRRTHHYDPHQDHGPPQTYVARARRLTTWLRVAARAALGAIGITGNPRSKPIRSPSKKGRMSRSQRTLRPSEWAGGVQAGRREITLTRFEASRPWRRAGPVRFQDERRPHRAPRCPPNTALRSRHAPPTSRGPSSEAPG